MQDSRFMNKKIEKHIVLVGFKNAGKSVLGKELEEHLRMRFLDLDTVIEKRHEKDLTCRQIMQNEGEAVFRELETKALKEVLCADKPFILAVGGGTVMNSENRKLLTEQTVVYISVDKDVLWGRIQRSGIPAFFKKGEHPKSEFDRIYKERLPIYLEIADVTVDNSKELEVAVEAIIGLTRLSTL